MTTLDQPDTGPPARDTQGDVIMQDVPAYIHVPKKQKKARRPALKEHEKVEAVFAYCTEIGLPFHRFLGLAFAQDVQNTQSGRGYAHAAAVSAFLRGETTTTPRTVVARMYANRDSRPSQRGASDVDRKMAKAALEDWAFDVTCELLAREACDLTDIRTGHFLRMSKDQTTWDRIHSFSFRGLRDHVVVVAPRIWAIALMLATPARSLVVALETARSATNPLPPEQSEATIPEVRSSSERAPRTRRHEPWIIALFSILMLMASHNLHANFFQKVIGLWFFANSAPFAMYGIASRIGLSISYSATLALLRRLGNDTTRMTRLLVRCNLFTVVYDNINRLRRRWSARYGQRDEMLNGTAAAALKVEECSEFAFDPAAFQQAQAEQRREALSLRVLEDRVPLDHLRRAKIMHCVSILVQHVPRLADFRSRVVDAFRSDLAIHRMPAGRRTEYYPLATSDCNVGTTPGTQEALDDIFLEQLDLDPRTVDNLLRIVCGDQNSVEKMRTLKHFLDDCTHGYKRYSWVLPLVQLWHMGWADLARILKTHWGLHDCDESGFRSVINDLGSKVKQRDRPDYRPTLRLITQTLHADVLSCWRQVLGADDLLKFFDERNISFEELCAHAEVLHDRYVCSAAQERARNGGEFRDLDIASGSPWSPSVAADEPVATSATEMDDHSDIDSDSGSDDDSTPGATEAGDNVLADWMLRIQDSLLHLEFQWAISDGDIGRVMAVINYWLFTFVGCGASKYAYELLELASMFEYELTEAMKEGVLNNWLANPTGKDGDWLPLDLLQERLIRLLKKLAERRDASFGATFFRDVVSRNIRGLLQVKHDLRGSISLAPLSQKHSKSKKDAAAMRTLATFNKDRELPKFRAGRTYGATSRNDFRTGHARLRDGKLAKWLANSLADLPHHAQHRAATQMSQDDFELSSGSEDELGDYGSDGTESHDSDVSDAESSDEEREDDVIMHDL